MREKIYRAGLMPVFIDDKGEQHFLFMQPSETKYGGDKYQIAKGRIEEDEESYDAAVRECVEELGLIPENMIAVYNCGRWLGRTFFYVAIVEDKNLFGAFHHETKSTKWMTPEEFSVDGRDIHREVVQHASDLVSSYQLSLLTDLTIEENYNDEDNW
jgi:8-oxo-dGTP pyrophosphatase MutT (NUDIX family)